MIILIIIRKRPPLVTGLALLISQLRGLLAKRATYSIRRWSWYTIHGCDENDDGDDDANFPSFRNFDNYEKKLFPHRWILFSVMALIPLAMSVLTVISLNPVNILIFVKFITMCYHYYPHSDFTESGDFFDGSPVVILSNLQYLLVLLLPENQWSWPDINLKQIKIDPMSVLGGRQWENPPLQSTEASWVQWPNNLCRYVEHWSESRKAKINLILGTDNSSISSSLAKEYRATLDNIGTVEMSSDVVQDILTKVHREKNITVLNMRGVVMSSDFVFGKNYQNKSSCLENFKLNNRQTHWQQK